MLMDVMQYKQKEQSGQKHFTVQPAFGLRTIAVELSEA